MRTNIRTWHLATLLTLGALLASIAGTAAQQKANVAESKGQPKANVELKTKEGQKELSKELKSKATP